MTSICDLSNDNNLLFKSSNDLLKRKANYFHRIEISIPKNMYRTSDEVVRTQFMMDDGAFLYWEVKSEESDNKNYNYLAKVYTNFSKEELQEHINRRILHGEIYKVI